MAQHARRGTAGHRAARRSPLGGTALVLAAAAVAIGTSGMLAMTAAQGSSPKPDASVGVLGTGTDKATDKATGKKTAAASTKPGATPTTGPAVAGVSRTSGTVADAPATSSTSKAPEGTSDGTIPDAPAPAAPGAPAPTTTEPNTPAESSTEENTPAQPEVSVPADTTSPSDPGLLGRVIDALL